jgi:hypothetical protein
MQRYTGVYDGILEMTDIILQDLFFFLVRNERLAGVKSRYAKRVVPLTFLGRSEDYYYTYAGDYELPIVVVSIPQSRVGSAWNWLAIPHEVGHHIISHFPGYDEEIVAQVAEALAPMRIAVAHRTFPGGMSNKELLAQIWFFWLEELVADIYGILYTGPMQVMARQEDASHLYSEDLPVNATTLDARQEGVARYPTSYIRCLFQTEVLRFLDYHDWADMLEARWQRRWGTAELLHWYDDAPGPVTGRLPLLSVSVKEMLRIYRAILPRIIAAPVEAFGGNRLLDLVSYDADDHERVLRVAEALPTGDYECVRKDRARHILAASRLAYEQHPEDQDTIHDTAVQAIRNCRKWLK